MYVNGCLQVTLPKLLSSKTYPASPMVFLVVYLKEVGTDMLQGSISLHYCWYPLYTPQSFSAGKRFPVVGAHGVHDPLSLTLLRGKELENLLLRWSHWSYAAHFPDFFEINMRSMAEKSHTPKKVQHEHVQSPARSRGSLYIQKCMQKSQFT